MQSDEYDRKYFRETRDTAGVLLTTMRPLWWRWVKIIRKYIPSGRLLDVGCGQGHFLQYAERYYETYGIDVSDYCIQEATQRTRKTELSVGGITHIDHNNGSFDIITCFDVLEHLEYPGKAMLECSRALKSGGIFIIRVPNTSSLGYKWKKEEWFACKDRTHVSLLSNYEWLSMLRNYDFELLDVFYDGLWDSPYFRYIPKFLQDIFIKIPCIFLFFIGVKFTERFGENICIVAKKGN